MHSLKGSQIHEGINWSIERGLVDPTIAEAASREIMDAIMANDSCIRLDHTQPKAGLYGYLMRDVDRLADRTLDTPGFGFGSLERVRKAIEPFKDPDLLKSQDTAYYHEGFINITEPNGKVPLHIDNEPWSLVFVSLAGIVKARIKHIDEARYSEVVLKPGDAVNIINPVAKRQRPKHEFLNLSKFKRVSYGEYTSQITQ